MVIPDTEIMSPGEVESPLQSDQQLAQNDQLGRQASIYSLTLDEFQHTLNENGKNFGSMNMDEFLTSIWNAEENQSHVLMGQMGPVQTQVVGGAATVADSHGGGSDGGHMLMGVNASPEDSNMIPRQLSLSRQASLSIPGSLSRKTVEEVWTEIQKSQQERVNGVDNSGNGQIPGAGSGSGSAQRQPTYGEMTLEDFLVKAGVVREQTQPNTPLVQPQVPASYGYNRAVPSPGTPQMFRPVMGLNTGVVGGAGTNVMHSYSPHTGYIGGKRTATYAPQPYAMVGNGGGVVGGYAHALGTANPASPASSDGIVTSQLDTSNQYGLDMAGMRSRKRIIDGPVEKVVERRQRRMIKNRESAARSRARKQAYTVELEAELNMLKEENAQLKQALAEIEREGKQQYYEESRIQVAEPEAQVVNQRSGVLRRTSSCST